MKYVYNETFYILSLYLNNSFHLLQIYAIKMIVDDENALIDEQFSLFLSL